MSHPWLTKQFIADLPAICGLLMVKSFGKGGKSYAVPIAPCQIHRWMWNLWANLWVFVVHLGTKGSCAGGLVWPFCIECRVSNKLSVFWSWSQVLGSPVDTIGFFIEFWDFAFRDKVTWNIANFKNSSTGMLRQYGKISLKGKIFILTAEGILSVPITMQQSNKRLPLHLFTYIFHDLKIWVKNPGASGRI